MTAPTFVVARNPEVGSRLPYLLQLTLTGGPLVLKARESWPRTAKVYCHRTDGDWPDDAAGYRGVELEILVDTRERYPYRFAGQQTHTTRCMLRVGDYAVEVNGVLAAAVERKSLQDLAAGLVDGSLAFLLAELATLPRSAVVVEDRYSRLLKLEHIQPGFVAELLAAVQVRYPACRSDSSRLGRWPRSTPSGS